MKRRYLVPLILASAVLAATWAMLGTVRPDVDGAVSVAQAPRISPDYSGTVIPPNIAPLNFAIREEGRQFFVKIGSEAGAPIEISSRSPRIIIPQRPWKSLLDANRGKDLRFEVFAEANGQWRQFQTITNRIADEDIDGYLAYRRIRPLYSIYRQTGVYQRDLTSFRESVVLDGRSLDDGCVNCHAFVGNSPDRMLIGIRSSALGNATLLADAGGETRKIGAKFGFTAWHPSGRLAAYVSREGRQFFHNAGTEVRDIVDLHAGLAYYLVDAHRTKAVPRASGRQRLDSYPAWSPDGRYLYYSSAPILWKDRKTMPPERYAEVKCDLMRIPYDLEADAWGEPEVVLSARETGLSILIPRISPDGRFLLCCMCRYGCFPAFQSSSDLYLMDMATRKYERMDINSDYAESWHSWSSNSRWIAFSSKRQSTPFTRCYLSFVDEAGKAHKAFILPQCDPEFYDSFLETISVPELITGPVPVTGGALIRAARSSDMETVADPAGGSEPRRSEER